MFWSASSVCHLRPLEILENKVIKIIMHLPRLTPTLQLYNEQILPVVVLGDLDLLIFIYKATNNLTKCNFSFYRTNVVHGYNTRFNQNFYISSLRTERDCKNVFHRGLVLFNKLPDEIKRESRIGHFKTAVRNFLYDQWRHKLMRTL